MSQSTQDAKNREALEGTQGLRYIGCRPDSHNSAVGHKGSPDTQAAIGGIHPFPFDALMAYDTHSLHNRLSSLTTHRPLTRKHANTTTSRMNDHDAAEVSAFVTPDLHAAQHTCIASTRLQPRQSSSSSAAEGTCWAAAGVGPTVCLQGPGASSPPKPASGSISLLAVSCLGESGPGEGDDGEDSRASVSAAAGTPRCGNGGSGCCGCCHGDGKGGRCGCCCGGGEGGGCGCAAAAAAAARSLDAHSAWELGASRLIRPLAKKLRTSAGSAAEGRRQVARMTRG
eukprot:1161013-Pelagomonas_calceolata.AAC.4